VRYQRRVAGSVIPCAYPWVFCVTNSLLCHKYYTVMSHIQMSPVAGRHEACHRHQSVRWLHESGDRHQSVKSRTKQSCRTFEWVMSHIPMRGCR
jgi:hypothetical protein